MVDLSNTSHECYRLLQLAQQVSEGRQGMCAFVCLFSWTEKHKRELWDRNMTPGIVVIRTRRVHEIAAYNLGAKWGPVSFEWSFITFRPTSKANHLHNVMLVGVGSSLATVTGYLVLLFRLFFGPSKRTSDSLLKYTFAVSFKIIITIPSRSMLHNHWSCHQPTNTKKQNPSSEADSSSVTPEIPCRL